MSHTKYLIFPLTGDELPTQPEPINYDDIGKHIIEWLGRYGRQGYYSNAKQERLPLMSIGFRLEPVAVKDRAEQLADAINALNDSDWCASYEYPGYAGVWLRDQKLREQTGYHLNWAWGYDDTTKDLVTGNDEQGVGNCESFASLGSLEADSKHIIVLMGRVAINRCAWLTEFANDCTEFIEKSHSLELNSKAAGLVNCWRQR